MLTIALRTPQGLSRIRYKKTKPNCIVSYSFSTAFSFYKQEVFIRVSFGPTRSFLSWRRGRHQFPFPASEFKFYWPFGLVFRWRSFSSFWREPGVSLPLSLTFSYFWATFFWPCVSTNNKISLSTTSRTTSTTTSSSILSAPWSGSSISRFPPHLLLGDPV